MKINDKYELAQISKEFKIFLAVNDMSLASFCKKYESEFPYRKTWEKLNRNSITIADVNRMIAKIDKSKELEKLGNAWKIV